MVYNALVFSHLKYCNIVWGGASKTVLKPLIALHNRIIKIMAFAPFQATNVRQFFEKLEVHNIEQINLMEVGKFMYKFKNDKLPEQFKEYFQTSGASHTHNLRSVTQQNLFNPG